MKKFLSLVLVGIMSMSLLSGCVGFATAEDAAPKPNADGLWYAPKVTSEQAKAEKMIEAKRKILLVIDFQVDFVDGALGTEEAVAIVPNVIEKIKSYDPADVYATLDTHFEENYFDTQEGIKLPVLHCVKDSPGWQLYPGVDELIPEDHRFIKYTFGSLDVQQFIMDLAAQEDIEVELIGLCTDICVVSNAMLCKASVPSMSVTIDASCCAGVSVPTHEAALLTMQTCQMNIINWE